MQQGSSTWRFSALLRVGMMATLGSITASGLAQNAPRYRVRDVSGDVGRDWSVNALNNSGDIIVMGYNGVDYPQLVYRRGDVLTDYGAFNDSLPPVTRINKNGEMLRSLPFEPITGAAGRQYILNLRTGVATSFPTTEPVTFYDWRDNYGVGMIGTFVENRARMFLYHNGAFQDIPGTESNGAFSVINTLSGLCNARGMVLLSRFNEGTIPFWNGTSIETVSMVPDNQIDIHGFNDTEEFIGYLYRNENPGYVRGKGEEFHDAPPRHSFLLINNRSEIVGVGQNAQEQYSHFVLRNGQLTYLRDVFPAPYSEGMGINCINDFGHLGGTLWQPGNSSRALVAAPQAQVRGELRSNARDLSGSSVQATMQSNLPSLTESVTLGVNGGMALDVDKDVPVTLRFHAPHHLVRAVSLTATDDAATFGTVTLLAGDANDDNVIDIADLLLLLAHFNQAAPSRNYLEACDFNADGINDFLDLLPILRNFNQMGD